MSTGSALSLKLVHPTAARYELRCLGGFRIINPVGDDATPRGRKARALLVYLALCDGTAVSRERLMALLWGDRADEQARASLRQALHELRCFAGTESPTLLTIGRDTVGLDPARIVTDLGIIEDHAASGRLQALAETLARWDGILLADLDGLSPGFDEWLASERIRRRDDLMADCLEAAEAGLARGETGIVRALLNRLEQLEPTDEAVARLGMRADRAAGDVAAVHRRYRRLCEHLTRELGTGPSPETQKMFERLRNGSGEAVPAALAPPAIEPQSVPSAVQSAPMEVPLPSHEVVGSAPAPVAGIWERLRRRRTPLLVLGLALLAALALLIVRFTSAPIESRPSIAVLPFADLSSSSGNGYFAEGVSEEILNLLAADPGLRVVGRTSASMFKGGATDVRTIGDSLGVSYLLEGSVRTADDRVQVSVRLIDADDGTQVWAQEYDRRLDDIFAVQDEIGASVAQRLSGALRPGGQRQHATTPEVYDRYLAARSLVRERRRESIGEARRLLTEAVALDPNYAPGLAALAEATMLMSDSGGSYGDIPVAEARAEAGRYVERALALAPNLAEAHAAQGLMYHGKARSLAPLKRAVALDPNRVEHHRWLAQVYDELGHHRQALLHYRRAAAIEPLWWISIDQLIGELHMMGRDAEIAPIIERFKSVSRNPFDVYLIELSGAMTRGDVAAQVRLSRAALRLRPGDEEANFNLAMGLALLGETEAALRFVPERQAIARRVFAGDSDSLLREVAAAGPGFWANDPAKWHVVPTLVAAGHGATLLRLYDQRYRTVDAFVRDQQGAIVTLAPPLVLAMQEAGRTADAERLRTLAVARIEAARREGVIADKQALHLAELLALGGDRDGALRELERTVATNWTALWSPPRANLSAVPAFNTLRPEPRFQRVEAQLRTAINRQRAQLGLQPLS